MSFRFEHCLGIQSFQAPWDGVVAPSGKAVAPAALTHSWVSFSGS